MIERTIFKYEELLQIAVGKIVTQTHTGMLYRWSYGCNYFEPSTPSYCFSLGLLRTTTLA